MDHKSALIELLGLKPDATDEVIANTAKTFQNDMVEYKDGIDEALKIANSAKETAESEAKTAKEEAETLRNRNAELQTEVVDGDLSRFEAVIENKDATRKLLLSNRAETVLELEGRMKKLGDKAGKQPIHNRNNGNQPDIDPSGSQAPADDIRAKQIRNRAREMQVSNRGLSWSQAWSAAQNEFSATA